jgi:glycosyltransferase involved in cell wall biosynthesis
MKHVQKKIFFISPYPHGTAPSQRFRYEQYLRLLKEEGYTIELYPFIDEKGWEILYQKGQVLRKTGTMLSGLWRRWKLLFKLKKADSIFIHREMAQFGPPVFEWIAAKVLGVKYIYDFDDAIWLPNYSASNAKIHWIKCYWKVPYCIKWADKVTAGNAYLADYAKKYNSNVVILPTTIDTENHHNRSIDFQNEKINIGWTGTHSTMNYLEDLVPVLKRLEQEFTFTFTIISNKQPDFHLDSLVYKDWKKETEIDDLAAFSIGVMPLREDKWSKGKCGFKALQYMSLGIPCVISPIGVNTDIISDGENGFLAATPDETYNALKKLMQDRQLRQTIGLKGQETIVKRYSTLANYNIYQQLFS